MAIADPDIDFDQIPLRLQAYSDAIERAAYYATEPERVDYFTSVGAEECLTVRIEDPEILASLLHEAAMAICKLKGELARARAGRHG